jgi:hypothetical protein
MYGSRPTKKKRTTKGGSQASQASLGHAHSQASLGHAHSQATKKSRVEKETDVTLVTPEEPLIHTEKEYVDHVTGHRMVRPMTGLLFNPHEPVEYMDMSRKLRDYMPEAWKPLVPDRLWDPVEDVVDQEYQILPIFPPRAMVFRALELVKPEEVKVVVVGLDPYINKGEAHGLAFSVPKGVKFPPSLVNIFHEAVSDVGIKYPGKTRSDDTWFVRQSVTNILPCLRLVRFASSQWRSDGLGAPRSFIAEFLLNGSHWKNGQSCGLWMEGYYRHSDP